MKINFNILWLGSFSKGSLKYPGSAESPAAKRFQENFISTLVKLGYEVKVCSFVPYPLWPKGPFYIKSNIFL